ncbi:hypothetical protein HDF16_005787 [Granulicella aggregans]|uniref:Uncharacterized protein n=1 Tax=Granulicella aggregans TaxID=474949 RepID=A0A7W8E6V1_9BACT|nr:hypothetical protein [Granulicella aggregans]
MHAVATTPAEPQGAFLAHSPRDGSLPRYYGGSASALRFSRPAQRLLALRPAYSPSHIMTLSTGGFSRFVASTAAPIATGWSESCRAGFAPAGKPCLGTAHTIEHVSDSAPPLSRSPTCSLSELIILLNAGKQQPRTDCENAGREILCPGISRFQTFPQTSVFEDGNLQGPQFSGWRKLA